MKNETQFPDTLTVRVTREDLKQPYLNSHCCPIATALRRAYPEFGFCVGISFVEVWKEYGKSEFYNLPKSANDKASRRAQSRKLWNRILGGFSVTLNKR